jgi:short-subunit dehydrogenase
MAMMTKIVIPKLMKRDKKSAVINLSSIAANTPSSIYAATKKFNDFFSRSLS